MSRIIGPANEFYRLRVTHLDEGGDVEFDWRQDVLWRSPDFEPQQESDIWVLEAVTLDELETVTPLMMSATSGEAHDALAQAQADLDSMSKSEFESAYIQQDAGAPEASE